MTKHLDPTRDDAGVRLRAARLRHGMTQTALADLACVSPALVSMIETGQRPLRSADHIFALADVLRVSPRFLIDGQEEPPAPGQPTARTVPFPSRADPIALARHQQLANRLIQLRSRRLRCRGLAAPTGPRPHRESVAAARPARHAPALSPVITQEMSHRDPHT